MLIIHGCHHKVGTNWFINIFTKIAKRYDLNFKVNKYDEDADILLDDHSNFNFDELPPFVGSHIIRDPRDMIVSAYFYHLTSDELWLSEPRHRYNGLSYQAYITSLDKHYGLMAEIKRASYGIIDMMNWDFDNPNIIEVRYEDLITNEQLFRKIFQHYGFEDDLIEESMDIVKDCIIDNPGLPGKWRKHFDTEHKQYFIELLGDCLIKLGYEINNDWRL